MRGENISIEQYQKLKERIPKRIAFLKKVYCKAIPYLKEYVNILNVLFYIFLLMLTLQ